MQKCFDRGLGEQAVAPREEREALGCARAEACNYVVSGAVC